MVVVDHVILKILETLYDVEWTNVSEIYRKIRASFTTIRKKLELLEEKGMIESRIVDMGRIRRIVKITEKGKEVFEKMCELEKFFE